MLLWESVLIGHGSLSHTVPLGRNLQWLLSEEL